MATKSKGLAALVAVLVTFGLLTGLTGCASGSRLAGRWVALPGIHVWIFEPDGSFRRETLGGDPVDSGRWTLDGDQLTITDTSLFASAEGAETWRTRFLGQEVFLEGIFNPGLDFTLRRRSG